MVYIYVQIPLVSFGMPDQSPDTSVGTLLFMVPNPVLIPRSPILDTSPDGMFPRNGTVLKKTNRAFINAHQN